MPPVMDDYQLEDIWTEHSINVSTFVPFVITRLRGQKESTDATLEVEFRDVHEMEKQRLLRIRWSSDSTPNEPLGVQERTITEWAACGVACALLPLYVDLRIRSVAAYGDKFDYWLSDQERDYGLEVSGTISGELEVRHAVKVNQLRQNPYGIDGYVVVVAFGRRQTVLSFHPFQELPT